MAGWSEADIPSQAGRVAIVTGSTGGIGFETARALAAAGAHVIAAGRNPAKGASAVERIRRAHPSAAIVFGQLDLASLASVRRFAEATLASQPAIDLLINNAGVMAIPARHETEDGFEQQFGANYLGHFALTGRLLPALRKGRGPRVVNVASLAHRRARIDFADPQCHRYEPWKAYCQSKLAMLMFGIEFQRRSAALGWGVMGVSAHPGWAMTNILTNGPMIGGSMGLKERFGQLLFPLLGQPAAAGALPTLYAATAPEAQAAGYYGPSGFHELKGPPKASWIAPRARDVDAASKLWALSVELTGVDPGRP